MFGSMDLTQVLRQQEELRRDAARQRLADKITRNAKSTDRTRRVFGLRFSLA